MRVEGVKSAIPLTSAILALPLWWSGRSHEVVNYSLRNYISVPSHISRFDIHKTYSHFILVNIIQVSNGIIILYVFSKKKKKKHLFDTFDSLFLVFFLQGQITNTFSFVFLGRELLSGKITEVRIAMI